MAGERRERRRQMTRSCAWCGRVDAGSAGWLLERREGPQQATHGICPECVETLERVGWSRRPAAPHA